MRTRLCILLLLACGCPRPACPTTPHTDPARALRMQRSLTRTVSALRAEARVDQRGERRIRGTVMLMMQRPDRVRFDALTQLGPAAVLTTDGESFQLLDHRQNAFLEGPMCPQNIARFLGMELPSEDVARFLVGDTPRLDTDDISMSCGDEGYTIELHAEDGRRQKIVLKVRRGDEDAPPDQQHLRIESSTMFHPDGRTDWRATYADYHLVADPSDAEGRGVAFPFAVRFVDPDLDSDTLVRIKEIDLLSDPPSPEVFRQNAPPGMPVQHAACE